MALGAIPALQERDLQVPSDVAVVGFDDIEDARFSTPPLTTARQPLFQQGEAAIDLGAGANQRRGGGAPQTTAATELVVRLSCGCLSGLTRPGRVGTVDADADGAREPARRARRRCRQADGARVSTFGGYAREAGFERVEILPIEHDFWRFYRLERIIVRELCAREAGFEHVEILPIEHVFWRFYRLER